MERLSNLVVAKVKILLSGLGLAYHNYLPCFVANNAARGCKTFWPSIHTNMSVQPLRCNHVPVMLIRCKRKNEKENYFRFRWGQDWGLGG